MDAAAAAEAAPALLAAPPPNDDGAAGGAPPPTEAAAGAGLSAEPPPAIRPIDRASVGRICSGQVILDLPGAVKELVENALDAGATSIEVRLTEHGLDLIEVADNGRGVAPADRPALALKHHTSKIAGFNDLDGLRTFGFRGEALSALAALGAPLAVVTRAAGEPSAARLEFDRHGRVASEAPCARGVGTTVAVRELFAPLPVRRQELARNVRREVAKLRLLLQQYAIMAPAAQLFASDQSGRAARTTLVSTGNAGPALPARVAAVLGPKVASLLAPLDVDVPEHGARITGLVSRAGAGVKGEKLRQFFAVNGRPVELPRAARALNDAYKSLYSSLVAARPLAFLNFELRAGTFDVNVTPDKRTVFVQNEAAILSALAAALQALWEPARFTYAVGGTQQPELGTGTGGRKASGSGGGAKASAARAMFASAQAQRRAREAAASQGVVGQSEPAEQSQGAADDDGAAAAAAAEEAEEGGDAEGAGGGRGASAPGSSQSMSLEAGGSSGLKRPRGEAEEGEGCAAPVDEATALLDTGAGGPSSVSEQPQEQQQQPEAALPAAARPLASTVAELLSAAPRRSLAEAMSRKRARARALPAAASGGAARAAGGAAFGAGSWEAIEAAAMGLRLAPAQDAAAAAEDGDGPGGGEAGGGDGAAASGEEGLGAGPPAADAAAVDVVEAEAEAAAGHVDQEQQEQQQPPPRLVWPSRKRVVESDSAALEATAEAERGAETDADVAAADAAGADAGDGGGEEEGAVEGQEADVEIVDAPPLEEDEAAASGGGGGEGGAAAAAAAAAEAGPRPPAIVGELPGFTLARVLAWSAERARAAAAEARARRESEAAAEAEAEAQAVAAQGEEAAADQEQQEQQPEQEQQRQQRRGRRRRARLQAASLADAAGDDENDLFAGLDGADATAAAAAAAAAAQADSAAAAEARAAAATEELARVFDKADFARMAVCGQFNLGFIVGRVNRDLFIVDQHAADEKSTFERLSSSLVLNRQPLLQPRRLPALNALDFQVIRDHLDAFERNGFSFVERVPGGNGFRPLRAGGGPGSSGGGGGSADVDAAAAGAGADQGAAAACDGGVEGAEEAGGELLLSAVPFSKGVTFGADDVAELVEALACGEGRRGAARPSKVRAMLASRACRSSIMIGRALDGPAMRRILARLADLDAPWNCPHGRPTMRHLAVLPDAAPAAAAAAVAAADADAAAAEVLGGGGGGDGGCCLAAGGGGGGE